MRQYLYLLLALFFLQLNAITQVIQDDFEGNGNITTWFGDDCGLTIDFKNPFRQGLDTSLTVLKYDDIGGLYANVRFDTEENFDLSKSHTFSFKIYVPSSGVTGNQANQVSLKLQNRNLAAPWSTQSEIIKPLILNQWQTLTFDFGTDQYINFNQTSPPPEQRTDFNRVLIQVNGENNNDFVVAYIDDVSYDGKIFVAPIFDQLVWSDEFNGNGSIDTSKWFHQTKLPSGGSWYNGEIQHYTDRLANSFVSNGVLTIVAKKETFTHQTYTKQYTSARLNSKYAFKYGKIEIRAKMPTGIGTWPAIWMLGKNINEDGAYWDNKGFGTSYWPACGEMDIMEHWGDNQNYVQSAMHTPSSYGGTVNLGGQTIPTASTEFHIYVFEWYEDKMVFSVDGNVHYIYKPAVRDSNTWPFDTDQYLLLNIAIQPSIDPSFTQSSMVIDYVRIYKANPLNLEDSVFDSVKVYPNPASTEINISSKLNLDKVELYDILGKRIISKVKNLETIDVNDLKSGFYVLKIYSEEKSVTKKVVIN